MIVLMILLQLFQCTEHHSGWFGSTTRLSFAGYFLIDCVDEFVVAGKAVVVDAGREVLLVAGLVVEFWGFSSVLADDTLRGG